MIDHISIHVADYAASRSFYLAALRPLGYEMIMEFDTDTHGKVGGLGEGGKPDLWLSSIGGSIDRQHIALRGKDRATVDAFYDAAIAAGGRSNGAPGLRPQYHEHYYGAFVLDPSGHNLEVVCHTPG